MQKQKSKLVVRIIWLIIFVIFIIAFLSIYNKYNFHNFTKSVRETGITSFQRDKEIKYSDSNSYKIDNADYNDAMFYQEVQVTPNTPYRVTCMVKTEQVENLDDTKTGGAHICIEDTTERSEFLVGNNDWTKVEFLFNSKNRETVNIGFRLGGFQEKSRGKAWFSDFVVEEGTQDVSNEWKFGFFIIENANIKKEENNLEKNVKLSMDATDVNNIKSNIARFKTSIAQMSENRMTADYDIIEIAEPITSISYDSENGYYAAPEDVYSLINQYVKEGNYDHIFIVMRLGDINKNFEGGIHDWIGLGGMDYFGIGYSNVKIPDKSNYSFTYNARVNMFPEEVFIHEFLHTLERNAEENGFERPELHSYEEYGYRSEDMVGLKQWYIDYMRKEIKSANGEKIGLPEEIYTIKTAKRSSFAYAYKMDALEEPENIIEEIQSIINRIEKLFSTDKEDMEIGWSNR